jgi:hypothetical protein
LCFEHTIINSNEIITKELQSKLKIAQCGYVMGEYRDNLLVIDGRLVSSEYMIPKDKVRNYDGRELSFNMRHDEINQDFKL